MIERFVGRSDRDARAEIEAHLGHELSDGFDEAVEHRYREAFANALTPSTVCSRRSTGSRFRLRRVERHPRPYAVHARVDRPVRAVRWPDLQRRRRGERQTGPRSVPPCGGVDGGEPADCVVVEDSRPGVQAARAAGMRVLAFAGGLVDGRLEGPDTIVFGDMRDLPKLVDERGPHERDPDGRRDGRAAGAAAAIGRRHRAIAEQVRAAGPETLNGITLVARGSSENRPFPTGAICSRRRPEADLAGGPEPSDAVPRRRRLRRPARDRGRSVRRDAEIVQTLQALQERGRKRPRDHHNPDSPLTHAAAPTIDLEVGVGAAVPATKTVTGQLMTFAMIAAAPRTRPVHTRRTERRARLRQGRARRP